MTVGGWEWKEEAQNVRMYFRNGVPSEIKEGGGGGVFFKIEINLERNNWDGASQNFPQKLVS